jgi:hypothetical protein
MRKIWIGAIAALLLVLGMGATALGETLNASTFADYGLYFINPATEAILGGWDSSGNFYIAGGIMAGTAQEFYAPSVVFGYDAGSSTTFATADTTGVLTITQAGSGPTTAWTVPVWTSTNSTSNTTYTPSNVVGFDAGSSMTTAVADTTGFATISHTGNATGFGWTATTGAFTCATSLTNLTPSYVVGYDAGSSVTFAVADTTGAMTVSHTGNAGALSWTVPTATWTNATSSTLYTPSYVVGFDAGSSVTMAVADTTGGLSVTHTGNATALSWTVATSTFTNATSNSVFSPSIVLGYDVGAALTLAVADTTGIATMTQAGNAPTFAWTVPAFEFTNATSHTTYTPSYVVGFDTGSKVTFAVADTSGALTVSHAGNATAVNWTATNFDFIGAMAADAVTLSDVLTFSDAGTIDNTAADTLTVTEDKIVLAGSVGIYLNGPVYTNQGNGAGAALVSTAVENTYGVHQTTVTFIASGANDLDIIDGGLKATAICYTFPAGAIEIIGATINATEVTNDQYNAHAADDFYFSIGSVAAAADGDLTGTEQDIIAKQTLDTTGATVATFQIHAQNSVAAAYDGTSSPVDLHLNIVVPAANDKGATTHTVTGTMTITWINLGTY